MKKFIVMSVVLGSIVATPAFASGDMNNMGGMHDMEGMSMPMSSASAAKKPSHAAHMPLADAEIKKVDVANGMLTLKHGALENVGMPPMTMAFKVKSAAMLKQVHEGDKVKVRVDNVNGTLTIVKLERVV
ncbi:copper-binding protein [Paraburkholderia bonniea]|uniref:copper-binding protein n=1 Tax=Paraburkholderia bonniea TaxID=2152891 RepID=UPI0012921947|nr:copper-binding protein [Paraburkholderia bonniea]WJF90506.1 copper-binding protein [Paraburkholderia bonniea]WJF93821.1 copper-binding protein [Paraburkholderia bonniea]